MPFKEEYRAETLWADYLSELKFKCGYKSNIPRHFTIISSFKLRNHKTTLKIGLSWLQAKFLVFHFLLAAVILV